MGNTHGLTGKLLQQPEPAPLRIYAQFDQGKPCLDHSPAFTGEIPCTGTYMCRLCGTGWNGEGEIVRQATEEQAAARERARAAERRMAMVADAMEWGEMDAGRELAGELSESDRFPHHRHSMPVDPAERREWLIAYATGVINEAGKDAQ